MKSLLIVILLVVYSNADEIQRIESIVEDITKLRVNYEKSQENLTQSLIELKKEKKKNEDFLKEVESLKKEIINLKNQIKNKDKTNLSNQNQKVKIKEKVKICSESQIVKKNEFPQLQMKKKKTEVDMLEGAARTYRLKNSAKIYDAIDGDVIEEWEERTSFTSNVQSGTWIKVTGYFIDKKWHSSTRSLWVKTKDAKLREK